MMGEGREGRAEKVQLRSLANLIDNNTADSQLLRCGNVRGDNE